MASENSSGIIKIVLIGGGIFLIYKYLQNSGLWAQWFGGGGNTIDTTDPQAQQKAIAYCQSNPGGSINVTSSGKTVGAVPCSAFIASMAPTVGPATTTTPPPVSTPVVSPAPTPPATTGTIPPSTTINTQLASQLTAGMQQQVGRAVGTVSEWNWVYQHNVMNNPNAPIITQSNYAVDQQISVTDYLALRSAQGLSGLGALVPAAVAPHMQWRM